MNTDHTYPPYCQGPPMHWQSTDPSHHALPAHTGAHPGPTASISSNDAFMSRFSPQHGMATLPPMAPAPAPPTQQMAQASVNGSLYGGKSKRQRATNGDSGGSDKACSSDEAARILEERRRRNASASARFRKRRNERERELVMRCMFLENQLLQALGPSAFESVMRKAPAVERNLLLGRHTQVAVSNADEDEGSPSPSPVSVSALTAPRSLDDVWSAYLKLSEQVAGVVQRIDGIEATR
ncbi:hypothetical protein LPJ63_003708 [Coemansia sp. RSA 2711]|nr:hypothetical protein LPJ63_003708 [Coemansia sp. RSA 2711]KAJ1849527.1 hypothetical protein LPJ70_000417 [Coemansia sp. RSA 2708]KAJ2312156.1 hypothetical protein IWW54_002253 [Coemansia sp. RSA 2705]KAJ2312585.1 hypothetical protein IWW52_004816 [Coemansia sp. RSA 2704]